MSADKQASPSAAPAKRRSPVETSIVRGGILVLLALVAVEFTSMRAHRNSVQSLLDKIKASEGTEYDVKASDVKAAVGNKVPVVQDVTNQLLANGGKRLEVYSWFSVNPLKKRGMYVYYGAGEDADVLSVSTEPQTEKLFEKYQIPTPE